MHHKYKITDENRRNKWKRFQPCNTIHIQILDIESFLSIRSEYVYVHITHESLWYIAVLYAQLIVDAFYICMLLLYVGAWTDVFRKQ